MRPCCLFGSESLWRSISAHLKMYYLSHSIALTCSVKDEILQPLSVECAPLSTWKSVPSLRHWEVALAWILANLRWDRHKYSSITDEDPSCKSQLLWSQVGSTTSSSPQEVRSLSQLNRSSSELWAISSVMLSLPTVMTDKCLWSSEDRSILDPSLSLSVDVPSSLRKSPSLHAQVALLSNFSLSDKSTE